MKKNFLLAAGILIMLGACKPSTKTSDKDAKVNADSTQIFNLDTTTLAAGTVYYQCPMDMEEISDKPGTCPKCGMALEPMTKK
jgi:hypothetical protein